MEIKHSNGRVEFWGREDLESVDWTYLSEGLAPGEEEGESEGGPTVYDSHLGYPLARLTLYGEQTPCGDLMAAAPALALACLEARRFIELLRQEEVFHRGGSSDRHLEVLRALDAALALAGVQP